MLGKIITAGGLLSLLASAERTNPFKTGEIAKSNFVAELTERTATGDEMQVNMMEFYGKIEGKDKVDNSVAYLTVLVTYDTLFKKMRLHFNMKEPKHEVFPEIDF